MIPSPSATVKSTRNTELISIIPLLLACLLLVGCLPGEVPVTTRLPLPTATESPTLTAIVPTATVPPTTTTEPTLSATMTTEPTTTATAIPTPPTWLSGLSGHYLLYQGVNRDNIAEIYVLQPGGTSQLITEGIVMGLDGELLSPDGTKFVFDNDGSSLSLGLRPSQLSLLDLVTGKISLLQLNTRPYDIFWSPDSQSFAYLAAGENGQLQIVVYDIEQVENRIITEITIEKGPHPLFWLVGFSPDGSSLAFIAKINGQYDVYSLDMNTLAIQPLTNTPEIEVLALWSPVSNQLLIGATNEDEQLVFNRAPYVSQRLYLMDSSSSEVTLLGEGYAILTAAWSPDGQKIAYSDYGTLCILELTTQQATCPLPEETIVALAINSPPAWSADGRWLAFRASLPNEAFRRLYLLDLMTNELAEVDSRIYIDTPAYWSR